MRGNLITFVTAFLAALLATPLTAALGRKLRALDYPNERKVHERAIPRTGGFAVAFAFFSAIAAAVAFDDDAARHLLDSRNYFVTGLALGSIAIVALGVYDDFRGMPAWGKLAVQILIAAAMWGAGFRVENVGTISVGLLSLPLTIIWLVGVTNAFNVIDGLDGLAAGVGVFALAILFGVSVVQDSLSLSLLSLALGGALIGFLFFNFNPARIFLGDCGSMFLGLVLGAMSIWTHMKSATVAAAVFPSLRSACRYSIPRWRSCVGCFAV